MLPLIITANIGKHFTPQARMPISIKSRCKRGHYNTVIQLLTFHGHKFLCPLALHSTQAEIVWEKIIRTARRIPVSFGQTMRGQNNKYGILTHLLGNNLSPQTNYDNAHCGLQVN